MSNQNRYMSAGLPRRSRISPMRRTSQFFQSAVRSTKSQFISSPMVNQRLPTIPMRLNDSSLPNANDSLNGIDLDNFNRFDGISVQRLRSAKRTENNLSQYNVSSDNLNESTTSDVHRFDGVRVGPPRDSNDCINPYSRVSSAHNTSDAHLLSESQATMMDVDLNASNTKKTSLNKTNFHDNTIERDTSTGIIQDAEKRRVKQKLTPCMKLCLLLSCLLCLALLIGAIIAAILLTRTTTTTTTSTTQTTVTTTTSTSTTTSTTTSSSSTTSSTTSTTTTSTTTTTTSTSSTISTSSSTSTSTTSTSSSTSSTSTTTTSTSTTTTFACLFTTDGLLESFGMSTPLAWTCYSYNYTANGTSAMLRFSSATANANKDWYIDDVSVVQIGGSSSNLLLNGDFESGSVGWQYYSCLNTCSASIVSSPTCYHNGGQCYHNDCVPVTNMQFVEQSFTTTIGAVYTIEFCLLRGGSGNGPGIDLYANVF